MLLDSDNLTRVPGHGQPLAAGAPANVTLYDPGAGETPVDPRTHASKSRNSPFAGLPLPGRVQATFLRGAATVDVADASGVELCRNPAGLIRALRKLQANDTPPTRFNHATAAMCIDDPLQHHEAWYHRLYDTHPPIALRIAQLERLAAGASV